MSVSSESLSPQAKRVFVGAYLGWFFDYYEIFILTFLVIPIAASFGLSSGQTASLFSLQLLALAVGGVGFGLLADRFGRRGMLVATVATYALATLARAFAPDYGTLLVLTIIAGLGIGGEYGVGQALVSEYVPAARRGWYSGVLYGACFVAIMTAAFVGGYVVPVIGWRWTFALSGLPVLLAFWIRASTPESPVWQARVARTGATPWRSLGQRSFIVPLLQCLIVATIYFFAYYGIVTFLPSYLVKHGLSIAKASWWLFFVGAAGLVGNLIASYATDRIGRRLTLSALMLLAVVSGLVLAVSWQSLLTSPWILVPFFLLFVGANGATVFGSLFSEVFPTLTRTTGVSTALQVGRGLAAIPPLVVAALLPKYGYVPVVVVSVLEFLFVGLWAWTFPETSGARIDAPDAQLDLGLRADGPEPAYSP